MNNKTITNGPLLIFFFAFVLLILVEHLFIMNGLNLIMNNFFLIFNSL